MKNRIDTRIVWICVIISWCLITNLALADEVLLRYQHTQGAVLNYDLTVETPNLQGSQKVETEIVRTVNSINDQDQMEISTAMNNGVMKINGISYTLPVEGQILTAVMNRRGEVTETTATGDLGDIFAQAGISSSDSSSDLFRSLGILEFPEEAVSEGSVWTVEKEHAFPNGDNLNVIYSYTLDSFVEHQGYNCAQISVDAQPMISTYQDLPSGLKGIQISGRIYISGILLFAISEGRIIQFDELIETNSIAVVVEFDGTAKIVPTYQETFITLTHQ